MTEKGGAIGESGKERRRDAGKEGGKEGESGEKTQGGQRNRKSTRAGAKGVGEETRRREGERGR